MIIYSETPERHADIDTVWGVTVTHITPQSHGELVTTRRHHILFDTEDAAHEFPMRFADEFGGLYGGEVHWTVTQYAPIPF